MAMVVVILVLSFAPLFAATPSDLAVFAAFRQADETLQHFGVLQRTAVTSEFDVVIAMGSPFGPLDVHQPWLDWREERQIGLFVQERSRIGRVYSLGARNGFAECMVRVERVTATDAVVSCSGEKSTRYANQKWVYDVRAKALIQQFSYLPFRFDRVFANATGAVLVGTNVMDGGDYAGTQNRRLVAVAFEPERTPAFRVLNAMESREWFGKVQIARTGVDGQSIHSIEPEPFQPLRFGPSGSFRLVLQERAGLTPVKKIEERSGNRVRQYPLPQSTYEQFATARPRSVENGSIRAYTRIEEEIGPTKLEDDRLWFGKSFYDGEGFAGVGGFGYFGTSDGKYRLFAPPELADWSVSAIEMSQDNIWMALAHNGEWGGDSGGLARYDRQAGTLRRFECPDIALQFVLVGEKLLAATDLGIVLLEGDQLKRFFIDRTTDGRLRVAPAIR